MKIDLATWNAAITYGAYDSEFNWFGIDKNGNVGVFTALLHAPIPVCVKASFEYYTKVNDIIDSLKATTTALWISQEQKAVNHWMNYAKKGLFAYDFQDVHRRNPKNVYDLMAKPAKPVNIEDVGIDAHLRGMFFTFDVDFNDGDVSLEMMTPVI